MSPPVSSAALADDCASSTAFAPRCVRRGESERIMLATGDVPSIATTALLATLFLLLTLLGRDSESPAVAEDQETFDVLPAAELSLAHVEVRPGNVLVPVRNPHSLAHVAAALQTARDRDVVVMTVRLLGVDVPDDASTDTAPTPPEERLLSDVLSVAERLGRPVRLLIVPASTISSGACARGRRRGGCQSIAWCDDGSHRRQFCRFNGRDPGTADRVLDRRFGVADRNAGDC